MKTFYSIILVMGLFIKSNCYAQNKDSLDFVKDFNTFSADYPITFSQELKYDSISAAVANDEYEKIKKNLDLFVIINKVDQKDIESLDNDSSGLVTFSQKENKYIIYTDSNINFNKIQSLTGVDIKKQFPKFYNQAKRNKIKIYPDFSIEQSSSEPFMASLNNDKALEGINLPILYNYIDYYKLSQEYWEYILELLDIYNCNPKLLSYYQAQENPGESWEIIANKRRKFINYIKIKCSLK